jgi:cytoskeletal protein CcmA (bactofilin family)
MFERNKNRPGSTQPAPETPAAREESPAVRETATARSNAMIGPSIVIKGTVSGDEDLLVQGRVEGSIELNSNEVSVGQSGRVTADINAKTVKIDGEVTGDISGGEKVVISKSGRVRGNIVAPRVTLEDGAIFKGSIDMDPGDSASTTVSLATQRGVDKPAEDLAGTPLEQKSG